jgi:hypothetical protein
VLGRIRGCAGPYKGPSVNETGFLRRHLLASLGSKLAILGPPRIVAEVPERLAPACELFSASGYVQEAVLTDYLLSRDENPSTRPEFPRSLEAGDNEGRFVIPVTVDDLAANGLLGEAPPSASAGQVHPVCWERSVETLTARKDTIAGLAVASDERIEAYLLYVQREVDGTEIVSLRTFIEDRGARLTQLLSRLRAQRMGTFRFPKVHPAEISRELLEALGFHPAGGHLLYAATLRPFEKPRGAPSNVEGRVVSRRATATWTGSGGAGT